MASKVPLKSPTTPIRPSPSSRAGVKLKTLSLAQKMDIIQDFEGGATRPVLRDKYCIKRIAENIEGKRLNKINTIKQNKIRLSLLNCLGLSFFNHYIIRIIFF